MRGVKGVVREYEKGRGEMRKGRRHDKEEKAFDEREEEAVSE